MDEHTIHWNAAREEWLCVKCLRSSDHITKEDAEHELAQFDCIELLGSEPEKPVQNERRRAARKKISVQADLVLSGHDFPTHVSTADLSLGGCYIESMFTLPLGACLTVTLWLGDEKLPLQGMVKTCDPVFGNAVEFTGMEPSDIAKLQSFLDETV